MSDGNPKKPLAVITDTDQRGVIVVVSAVTLSFLLVCFLTRVYVRLRRNGPWSHDDSILSVATLVGVSQSIAVFLQVHQGFGVSPKLLSDGDFASIGKLTYAITFLFLVSHYLSKCSVTALIMRITSNRQHLLLSWATVAASTIWALSSILVITIRCNPAEPYTDLSAKCSGLFARQQYICAFDIITEVAIFAISICLVVGLQMSIRMKITVVSAFALRLPVIPAIAVRLYYLHREIYSSEPTLAGVPAAVWTQIELNYGLMATAAACLGTFIQPFSKPYLVDASYGSSRGNQRSARVGYNLSNISSSGYMKRDQSSQGGQSLAKQSLDSRPNHQAQQRLRPDAVSHDVMVSSNNRQSLDSHDSKRMIITKGVEWSVQHDETDDVARREGSNGSNQI